MAHWTIHNVTIEVKTGDLITDIKLKKGMIVNSNDEIAKLCTQFRGQDGKISTIKDIHSEEVVYKEIPQLIPANIENGYIIDMGWQHNKGLKKLKDAYRNQVIVQTADETEGNLAAWEEENKEADVSELKNVPDRYRNQSIEPYDFGQIIQETLNRKLVHDVLVLKIAVRRTVQLGDKVCNRFGLAE